jgi:hypothetical protein
MKAKTLPFPLHSQPQPKAQSCSALRSHFRANTDVVGMASFQFQTETGRGVLKQRNEIISLQKKENE